MLNCEEAAQINRQLDTLQQNFIHKQTLLFLIFD